VPSVAIPKTPVTPSLDSDPSRIVLFEEATVIVVVERTVVWIKRFSFRFVNWLHFDFGNLNFHNQLLR
jgi:hypothetical protein